MQGSAAARWRPRANGKQNPYTASVSFLPPDDLCLSTPLDRAHRICQDHSCAKSGVNLTHTRLYHGIADDRVPFGRDYVARKKVRANVGARKEVSPRGMAAHTGIIRATPPSEALPTSASSWLGRP